MKRREGRILAFQALFAWEMSRADPALLAEFWWRDAQTNAEFNDEAREDDCAFPRLLFLGTLEHIDEIDAVIRAHLVGWEFARVNKVDLALLRLSVYTLLFQRDVHPTIVINEAVDIAKEFSMDESYKFVNAMLDTVRKENITRE
ncbi:MAG: transcription antitermination factor NusB [Treponemataceae bacterium]|nr:MAG: transcription antitermination factor NusB [Treponemataceae bacterium]